MTPDDYFDEKIPDSIVSDSPPNPDPADIEQLGVYVRSAPTKLGRGKIKELSVFTMGVGAVLIVLSLWLSFALQPAPGDAKNAATWIIPIAIGVVFIVLGILTRRLRSAAIIQVTLAVVVAGFAIDLLLSFNVVKAIIDGLIIAMVVKTGRQALVEARS